MAKDCFTVSQVARVVLHVSVVVLRVFVADLVAELVVRRVLKAEMGKIIIHGFHKVILNLLQYYERLNSILDHIFGDLSIYVLKGGSGTTAIG